MLRGGAVSHALGRLALTACVATLLLAALAAPASAHGRSSDATNYRATVTDAPAVDGVTWTIYGGDELLAVTNTTDEEVVVYGYRDEPYVRVGPDGVFENRNSPAAYLNTDRYSETQSQVPEHADAEAEPDWVHVGDRPSYAWHDHRIHYMSPELPASVAASPDTVTEVRELSPWAVPFSFGGERMAVEGELHWVPGPSPWPWLLVALAVTLPALAGLRTRPQGDRWPGLARPAAVVLGLVAVANLVNLADDLFAVPLPWTVTGLAALQTLLFLAVGLFGAVRGWQARDGAFTALGVGAGAVFVGQGLLYLPALGASQLATLLPDAVPRAVAALSIAQAVPVGIVAFVGARRLLARHADVEGDDRGVPAASGVPSP